MIGAAPQSPITKVPGWETIAEQHYLLELARTVPDGGIVVEIGAEWGMSASLFAFGTGEKKNVRIVSIDTFQGNMLDSHRKNLAEAGLSGRSEQIVGDSNLVGDHWNDPIDLLFVDGDHSFEGCLSDIRKWSPFVRLGGLIVFHDVAQQTNLAPHHLHFEVTRAISQWQLEDGHEWENLRPVDTIAVWKRVKALSKEVEPKEVNSTKAEEKDIPTTRASMSGRATATSKAKQGRPRKS